MRSTVLFCHNTKGRDVVSFILSYRIFQCLDSPMPESGLFSRLSFRVGFVISSIREGCRCVITFPDALILYLTESLEEDAFSEDLRQYSPS